ncbi:MAG: hypothetical protein AAF503_11970, partial [Pseudomonadota bacterium]
MTKYKLNITGYIILCGTIFASVFALHYAFIDPNLYEFRDDGVITMSVGRHLVEYGFFGVSPSGPIVEASSSPVQTLLYAAAYALTGASFKMFATVQTYVATFLIGVFCGLIFATDRLIGLICIGFMAIGLSFVYPFFLWHGSGMENALTHTLFAASVTGMVLMVRKERVDWAWALPMVLCCFARPELIVWIALLLGVFSFFFWRAFRRLDALWLTLGIGAVCFALHGLRFAYFEALLPNTAIAQQISVGDRLDALLHRSGEALAETKQIASKNFSQGAWWIGWGGALLMIALPKPREFRFRRAKYS